MLDYVSWLLNFTPMETLLFKHYGLENISLTKMEGYVSTNFRVDSDQGRFVLKVYPISEKEDVLAETELIQQLNYLPLEAVSNPIKNSSAEILTLIRLDGEEKLLRLITFVEGQFMAEAEHTDPMLRSLGSFVAKMDRHLIGYQNQGIQARNLDWDLKNISVSRQLQKHIISATDRKLVAHFFLQWDQHVFPKMSQLRKSIIHNDANDWNVLVNNGEVTGIIDFGDAAHTAVIFELAITITYALFGKEDPVKSSLPIIAGFHSEFPILKEELDLLYYLIAGRLCMGVCTTANEKKIQPDNKYILISEAPAWALLKKWVTISPIYAKNQFYAAAGFEIN